MKKIFSLLIAIVLILSLSACTVYEYAGKNEFGVNFGYSKLKNDCFVASITYSRNDTTEIVIPNTFNNAPVVALGGYTGTGYPNPFLITCDDDYFSSQNQNLFTCTDDFILSIMDKNTEIQVENVVFKIQLPDSLKEIVNATLNLVSYTEQQEGQTKTLKVFRPVYYFEISESNGVFYTKDGKLYYKNTNELFSECIYEEYSYGSNT